MKLTIGMIVKNEEKWLDKCLSAIKPILNNVDSELIVTDTGSTDKTVEIAEKYTDKVLHFDWINDFATARNTAFEIAQGEWFMFLDADEIFRSCEEIINFFNSGEYKKYNSASVIIRNLDNQSGSGLDVRLQRLTKRLQQTRFTGIVHELLNTYGEPVKQLNDVALHYGYYYENEEEKRAKYERNQALLLKRLEQEKDSNPYIYMQLSENALEDSESLKYIEDGILVSNAKNGLVLTALLIFKAYIYLRAGKYADALIVCEDYHAAGLQNKRTIHSDLEMTAIKALSLYRINRMNEAFDSYSELFELIPKSEITCADDIIIARASSPENYISFLIQFLNCAAKTKRYADTETILTGFNIGKYPADENVLQELINAEVDLFEPSNYEKARKCFDNFNDIGKKIFIKRLEQCVFYSHNKEPILALLHQISGNDILCDIYDNYFGEQELSCESLVNFTDKYGINGYPSIIMIALNEGYDISLFIDNIRYEVKQTVADGYSNIYGFHKAVENYDINKIDSGSLTDAVNFIKYCMDATVDFKSPKPGVYVIINANRLIEKFGMLGKRIEQENSGTSSDIIQAAVVMGKALDYRNRKQYRECISELKNVVRTCGSLAKYVSDYSNEVITEYNEAVKLQSREMSEMERLAIAIKGNIRKFIASRNIAAAQKTLADYKAIAPTDAEISDIEAAIHSNN